MNIIKELRLQTGLSQKDFAKYINIPHRTLQNWEEDKRKCPNYIIDLIIYKLENQIFFQPNKFCCIIQTELEKKENDYIAKCKIFDKIEDAEKYGEEFIKELAGYPAIASYTIYQYKK